MIPSPSPRFGSASVSAGIDGRNFTSCRPRAEHLLEKCHASGDGWHSGYWRDQSVIYAVEQLVTTARGIVVDIPQVVFFIKYKEFSILI
jgi:hypothetical protein